MQIAKLDAILARIAPPTFAQRLDAAFTRIVTRLDAEFKESDHPRAEDGKFGEGGGAAAKPTPPTATGKAKPPERVPIKKVGKPQAGHEPVQVVEGKRVTATGAPLPAHILALKLPPAWHHVSYSADPDAKLLAVGYDSMNRRQPIYSKASTDKGAADKFERVAALDRQFNAVVKQNYAARRSDKAATRDAADCLHLIAQTGIRPGSESDTGAKRTAYGATTLLGQHVQPKGDGWALVFGGKDGVDLDIPIDNPEVAAMLRKRAKAAGPDGQLFGAIDEKKLAKHAHTLGDGTFKTKDFRTLLGTRTAMQAVSSVKQPPTDAAN